MKNGVVIGMLKTKLGKSYLAGEAIFVPVH
jgi:hypothetical protein